MQVLKRGLEGHVDIMKTLALLAFALRVKKYSGALDLSKCYRVVLVDLRPSVGHATNE